MKRGTVVRHCTEIAQEATRLAALDTDVFKPTPLAEVWIGGDLVEQAGAVEHAVAILVFDLPAEELPEIALHDEEQTCRSRTTVGRE